MNRILRVFSSIFVFIIIFYFGFGIGYNHASNKILGGYGGKIINEKEKNLPDYLKKDVNFSLYKEVAQLIQENYVDRPVPETQLFYGALAGEVASLGDPYSVFFNPELTKEFNKELSSELEGIGAEIGIKNNFLTIISPLPNSPAKKAGLLAGDKIYKIDGEEALELSLGEAVKKIRGKAGTKVVLTIIREGEEKPLDIEIIRAKIHYDTVKWKMEKGNILYVEVSNFNQDTAQLFNKMVNENINKNIKGIVFDLRNNPGGFLDVAIEIAGKWIKNGDPVLIERFNKNKETVHPSNGKAEFNGIPTVVLVNKGSASASEIVAGALQDYGLAVLVGEKTFGKGSVQSLFDLSDNSSLKLTIAKWLTPQGRAIDKKGIKPDIEVGLSSDDYDNDRDPQKDKAFEILKKRIFKKKDQ